MKLALSSKGLICLLAAGVFFTSPACAETLQEAVKYMIETNPQVRSAAHGRLARDQQIRQARSGYLPTFDLEAGAGKNWMDRTIRERELIDPEAKVPPGEEPAYKWDDKTYSNDLTPLEARAILRQNIFHGLATRNEIERQQARVRSGAYSVQATSEDTALKTVSAYLEVLRRQELVKLAEKNLDLHQRMTDKVWQRSTAGVGTTADIDQIETRLNLAKSDLVISKQNLMESEANYLSLVGRLPVDLVLPEPNDSLLPLSIEDAVQEAVDSRPGLKAAIADIEARRKARAIADAPFMPIIDIEAQESWDDEIEVADESKEEFKVMLTLRYNLFNGFKDEARKAEATQLISEAREIRNQTERKVVESVQLSWRAYQSAIHRLPLLEKRVMYAKESATAYEQQWEIGKRTLLDVLNTEAEYISADRQRVNAEFDLLYAQYRLLNGIGKLVPSLELEWPEESRLADGS
jgi:adhesin transport system outer membrane protein